MEETKKRPGRPKKVVNETANKTTAKTEPTTNVPKTVSTPKKRLLLNDNDEVVVRSNVFGELIYINDRTGSETFWDNCGEEQVLSAKDIKDMKAKQQTFFKEDWVTIVDAPSVDFEEYTMKDVYESLQIGKYYKDNDPFGDIDSIFSMNESKMKQFVSEMTETAKRSLIICANDKIKNGTLDSISKVKLLEEVLGCELASPTD